MSKLEVEDTELTLIQENMRKAKEDGKEHLFFEDLLDVYHSKPGAGAAHEDAHRREEMQRFRSELAGAILSRMQPLFRHCRVSEHENRDGFRIFMRDCDGRGFDVEYTYLEGISHETDTADVIIRNVERKIIEARDKYLTRMNSQ